MSRPTTIQIPQSCVKLNPTTNGHTDRLILGFPNSEDGVPWEVGLLFSGPISKFVHTELRILPPASDLDFTFTGTGQNLETSFFLSSTFARAVSSSSPGMVNVGWFAAENASAAGTILFRHGTSNETPSSTNVATYSFNVPSTVSETFLNDLSSVWADNYSGTGIASINGQLQESVVVCFFDDQGRLLALFDGTNTRQISLNINSTVYMASFLVPHQAEDGSTLFTIGDPRTDGTMSFSEA